MEVEVEVKRGNEDKVVFRTDEWGKVRITKNGIILAAITNCEGGIIVDHPNGSNGGKDVLEEAIRKYGYTAQVWMVIEELSELMKELCKLQRNQTDYNKLVDELADAFIMLNQLQLMLGITDEELQVAIHGKAKRLAEKLRDHDV